MKEKITVVKVGGAVVEDEAQLAQLLKDFSAIEGRKVLVHGGGRRATKVAGELGIETKMVDGRRITDAAMLDVVTMVYGGLVNKNLVARLQALRINALGLTGADINCLLSRKRPIKDGAFKSIALLKSSASFSSKMPSSSKESAISVRTSSSI